MTNNTEPVTQEDRDAAVAFDKVTHCILSPWAFMALERAFADRAVAAVAKREAEIVGAAIRFAGENDKSGVYGSVYASVTLRSFVRWIQTGGGA